MDDACRDVGRDPAEVERTVAVLVRLPGGSGRLAGDVRSRHPADQRRARPRWPMPLRAFATEGIGHVQLVLDPITLDSIKALAPVLDELDRG